MRFFVGARATRPYRCSLDHQTRECQSLGGSLGRRRVEYRESLVYPQLTEVESQTRWAGWDICAYWRC